MWMESPRIIVVGSFVQDLTFNCVEFPRPGETVIGQFLTGPGGKGSNQAVAAARAGGRVAFIGAVGKDAFGAGARVFQEAEGIRWLAAEKTDRPTGAAGILVNSHGQNEIIVSLDANDALTPADVEAHSGMFFREAAVFVTQLEANLAAEAHAMEMARSCGMHVILNPAPMRSDFDPLLLKCVDIVIPNETEFAALIRMFLRRPADGKEFDERELATLEDEDLHGLCRLLGVAMVIVTLGERGCFVSQPETYRLIPAMKSIVAVDTTGAGDAFVGAFAAALAELGTGEIERAARFANAGAALSVTKAGTAPAMPRRAEIDALLAGQG